MVIGTTSSGKSTFLNCLLQRNFLPEAHGPCTSSVCEIRYSEIPKLCGINQQPTSSPVAKAASDGSNQTWYNRLKSVAVGFFFNDDTSTDSVRRGDDTVHISWPGGTTDPLKVDLTTWLAPRQSGSGDRFDFIKLSVPVDFLSSGLTIYDSPGLGDSYGNLTTTVLPMVTTCVVMINSSSGFDRSIARIFEECEPLISPTKCLFLVTHMDQAIEEQRKRCTDKSKYLASASNTHDAEEALEKLFQGMDRYLMKTGGWTEEQVQIVNPKQALNTIIDSENELKQVMIQSDLAGALMKVSSLFSENITILLEESCNRTLFYLKEFKKEVLTKLSVCRTDADMRAKRFDKWFKFSTVWKKCLKR